MDKYFLINDKEKIYWEYWKSWKIYTIHYWNIWTIGVTEEITNWFFSNAEKTIEKKEKEILSKWYKHLNDIKEYRLIIEYNIEGFWDESDIVKRHNLQNKMDELIGWNWLWMCDWWSTWWWTMEVCCFVIDFNLAKKVIENDLKDTEFSDYIRIYDEDME